MPTDDLGHRAVDDTRGIEGHVHDHPHAPPACWDQPSTSSLTHAAVVEFQRREHRRRCLQQFTLDAEITEGAEIRAHEVATGKEWPYHVSQSCLHLVAGGCLGRVMPSDQQPQAIDEIVDRITNLVESLLPYGVVRETGIGTLAGTQGGQPPDHRGAPTGAWAIASARSRYAVFSAPDTASTGTPCIPA